MEDLNAKNKILKEAAGLFTKYGVRSISMDDIARNLSISKKTLYQHFADKEDIVTQCCQIHLQENCRDFEAIQASAVDAIDELAKISLNMKKHVGEVNPSLLFDLRKYYPKAWAAWLDFKKSVIYDSVKKNLDQGKAEGFFRPELNSEMLAIIRLVLIEAAFDEQNYPHDKFNITEVQMQLFDHFVYGIVTDKGRKQYHKYKESHTLIETPITPHI
jgi:AcrR family transcriptional regulator